jgi:hypothetical protein
MQHIVYAALLTAGLLAAPTTAIACTTSDGCEAKPTIQDTAAAKQAEPQKRFACEDSCSAKPEVKDTKTACSSDAGCEAKPAVKDNRFACSTEDCLKPDTKEGLAAKQRRPRTMLTCSTSDCGEHHPGDRTSMTAGMDQSSPAWKWIKRLAQTRAGKVVKACDSSDC